MILGQYGKAEPNAQRALQIRRRMLGGENLDTLDSLHSLGATFHLRGDSRRAEPLYREHLAMSRKLLREGDAQLDTSRSNLAGVLQVLGRYSEAESLWQESLRSRRRNGDASEIASTLAKLAGTSDQAVSQGEERAGIPLLHALRQDLS
jgi:tetratricopeptide (TPR) repeat protein